MDYLELVISQAPENLSREKIEEVFLENGKSYVVTLMKLWNMEYLTPEVKKDRWTDIRDICDTHDIAMENYMNTIRNKITEERNSTINENTIITDSDNYITSNI